MASPIAPSGHQWTLTAHDQELVVVESGGGIRQYRRAGRDLVHGFALDRKADAGRGQHLFPWPNRIRDGRYTFGEKSQQLALTEPARANASHGLTRWSNWHLVEQTDDTLTVGYLLLPQQGWDGVLDLSVEYRLTEHGLTVTPSATNVGTHAVPFGYGAHPYLTAGEEVVDDLTLTLPVDTVLDVDERLIPVGTSPVTDAFDFRTAKEIGRTQFDHAFTGLRVGDPRWEVSVRSGNRCTTLWADARAYKYVQVFTGDSLPGGAARRSGVAVEPMTCPANAFATGEALIVLEPGQTWSAPWGITAAESTS